MYKKLVLALGLGASFIAKPFSPNQIRMYLGTFDKNTTEYTCADFIKKLEEIPDNSVVNVKDIVAKKIIVTGLLTPEVRAKLCKDIESRKDNKFNLKTAPLTKVPSNLRQKVKKSLKDLADKYVESKEDKGNEQEAA